MRTIDGRLHIAEELQKKSLWKWNEDKSGSHCGNCTVNNIPCCFPVSFSGFRAKQHVTPNSSVAWGEILWIPCSFPASRADFAHFGHNLRFSGLTREKFPAKFPAPGNLGSAAFFTIWLNHHQIAAACPRIFFHSLFQQSVRQFQAAQRGSLRAHLLFAAASRDLMN